MHARHLTDTYGSDPITACSATWHDLAKNGMDKVQKLLAANFNLMEANRLRAEWTPVDRTVRDCAPRRRRRTRCSGHL